MNFEAFEANEFLADGGAVKCQRMIDILLQIMLGQNAHGPIYSVRACYRSVCCFRLNFYFQTLQIGILFTFICRLIVSKEDQLFVRRDQLHQVKALEAVAGVLLSSWQIFQLLEASLRSVEEGSFNNSSLEKQQALLELLSSPQGASMLDLKMVLKLAEKAQL